MYKIIPIFLLLLLTACSSEDKPETITATPVSSQTVTQHPPFQSITPTTAMRLIGNKPDLLIIDVRTAKEIRQYGALANSQHIEIGTIARNGVPFPEETPLLIVCAVGGRSYAVGKYLVKKGHTEIYNLSGGLDRWIQEGLPVVHSTK